MAIKRYTATKDNTITNAFGVGLSTRATGSNMGASDILEIFSIYGQQQTTSSAATGSVELSRLLVEFPISTISANRTANLIPASGSVNFFLRMFNARHSEQLAKDITVNVLAVSQSWQEGTGLDMVSYTDTTRDSIDGSNWSNRERSSAWGKPGGEYHSSSYTAGETMPNYTYTFTDGYEDLELDVTAVVEEWIAGTQPNYGFGVFLTSSQEGYVSNSSGLDSAPILHNPSGSQRSYYTKKFFSRSSEFFFKKPVIEARWDSRITDDRGNFYASSSIASGADNLNNLYLYNYIRGRLADIPRTEVVSLKLYASSNSSPTGSALATATATKLQTGIYKAQIAIDTTASVLHDVWSGSLGGEYKTGSISVKSFNDENVLLANAYPRFTSAITNLKPKYVKNEQARLRVFSREIGKAPTLYTVATSDIQPAIIQSASFEVLRMLDEHTVINNSTGSSTYHTYLSYDNSGSYFDLDMSLLEPGYMYGIRLSYHVAGDWREQEEVFKFRVEDN
jgi:hypothetical protein